VGGPAGVGLLPAVFEGAIRYRPQATCWGCDGRNSFSIGFGVDTGVYGTNSDPYALQGVLVTGTVDLMYMHRFAEHFGFVVGTRWGIGAVTEFGDSAVSGRLEPTLKIQLLQIGIVF
jgi:hypothetical protein